MAPGRRIARRPRLREGVARRAQRPRSNLGHVNTGAPSCAGAEVIDRNLAALDRPSQGLRADPEAAGCLRDRGELRLANGRVIQASDQRLQAIDRVSCTHGEVLNGSRWGRALSKNPWFLRGRAGRRELASRSRESNEPQSHRSDAATGGPSDVKLYSLVFARCL